MIDDASAKVRLGKGWHNTGTTVASADYNTDYEGVEHWGGDLSRLDTAGLPAKKRSQRGVLRVLVRNTSAISLRPKALVTWQSGQRGKRVDGYARLPPSATLADGMVAGAVDEHWPSAGVPVGELFWLVVKGPALVTTGVAADATNVIAVGDLLVGATAAATNSTTAGRARPADLNVATTALAYTLNQSFGKALSAKTTANTAADLLVNMNCWTG